jgi:hypothetical protein
MEAKNYDLIVGIPSYNEADSIEFVTKQIDEGLNKYYSHLTTAIINVDNNSPDNTKNIFLNTKTKNQKIYLSTPEGVKGKGNNFYNLFKFAKENNTKAVVVVDADLKSITPEWIKKLAEPVLKDKDFVSPLYIRHKYDGTITNNIVFPLIYSLFNQFIRQPIGGEFSISNKLLNYYMKQEWEETTKQYGIDIFMTFHALSGNFKTEQVLLGAKLHKPSAPKLGEMFTQVVDTFFKMIILNKKNLNKTTQLSEINYQSINVNIPEIEINSENIKNTAIEIFRINIQTIESILSNELINEIKKSFTENNIEITEEIWSKIVFEFLKAYEKNPDKNKIIEPFKAFYFARTYTFINKTKNIETNEAEKLIIKQAKIFSQNKKIFLD